MLDSICYNHYCSQSMKKIYKKIYAQLSQLKEEGLHNKLKSVNSPMSGRIDIDDKELLNFCSNNYLGLANNERIKNAVKKAIDDYGIGPGAVRTIAGNHKLHDDLENTLAEFKEAESAIVLQSGFTANLAVIPAITDADDIIFSDELNHASIIDGCRLSKAEVIRYKHNDISDLRNKLAKADQSAGKLIVSDGVFSMDGDIALVADLQKIAEEYEALLMIDDAHGEGVLGKNGRGIVNHFGLQGKVDIEIGTLSKAFGVVGGYVTGNKLLIEWLKQRGRPFLFSSALTIPDTAAALEAVKILEESDELVKKLWENTVKFKEGMKKFGFDIGYSQTPIIPVMLGDAKLAKKFSKVLYDNGLFATAIAYPTVPQGKARIRVMMSADHTKNEVTKALDIFKKVGKELKII